MTCNCIGGNPCPCMAQRMPGLQWPYGYAPAPVLRAGWVCPRCQAVNNPDLQQCHSCTPVTASGHWWVGAKYDKEAGLDAGMKAHPDAAQHQEPTEGK